MWRAMDVRPLSVPGAWEFTPRQHSDKRGIFLECYEETSFIEAIGYPLPLAQTNVSVSRRDVLRGIHFADVPPGQAKYIYCPRGAFLDVVVDIRVGSPTFGHHDSVVLDDTDRRAIYVSEGLGHAAFALTDDATLNYLCSTGYNPTREHGIHPLDPGLELPWPKNQEPLLSPKDAAAPTLHEAKGAGLLPNYDECLALHHARKAEHRTSGQ